MTYCAVKGCHNCSEKRNKDLKISFHVFPSDPIEAARWIDKIRLNRKDEYWKPTKFTKICSEHFSDTDKFITERGLCKLRPGTVPTKNLHILCTESENSNLSTNDNFNDPLELCKPQMSVSPNASIVNVDICTASSFCCVINSNEPQMSTNPIYEKGDSDLDSIFDTPQESKLRKQLTRKNLLQRKYKKKILYLQQKNRRLQKKNISLQTILGNLRNKEYIDDDISNILSENVIAAELYNNLVKKTLKNKKHPMPKCTPEFRKFCNTLHFYSPRAYKYVRKTFNFCLPHPKTMLNCYRKMDHQA